MACNPKPKINLRKAEQDDFEAVLDINKEVYDGCDYIHLYYKELISDPDYNYYVVEVDGEVAAFEGIILLDEGKTLMTRSARVKETFKGMGLLSLIRKQIYEDYKDLPAKKRIRTSCTNVVRLVDSKKFRLENRTVLRRELCTLKVVPTKLVSPDTMSKDTAKAIQLDEFAHLLDISHVKLFLFPDGIFTTSSWFFDTLASNVALLGKLDTHVVVTHPLFKYLQPTGSVDISTVQSGENLCCHGLLAIGSYYFCPMGLFYHIDIFGTPTKGKEKEEISTLLRSHVIHLQDILKQRKEVQMVIFPLNFNEGTSKEVFKEALCPLGFSVSELNDKYLYQYYFEQDFEKLVE